MAIFAIEGIISRVTAHRYKENDRIDFKILTHASVMIRAGPPLPDDTRSRCSKVVLS